MMPGWSRTARSRWIPPPRSSTTRRRSSRGLKAYRQAAGLIATFRPWANAARFNSSARRMAMPELPEEAFVRAIELLVAQDRAWVPDADEYSLYLRPVHHRHAGRARHQPALAVVPVHPHRLARRRLLPERRQAGHRLAVGGVHPLRTRGHRRRQVRRQLRRLVRRAAAGRGPRLRPGRLAGRRGAPLGRGDGRHEPVLRLRHGAGREDHDAGADRDAAARGHPGLAADPRPGSRLSDRGGQDLGRRVAGRLRGR